MYRQVLVIFIVALVAPHSAFAGAWGTGAFENDDALDWVWELEESSDLSVLRSAIDGATPSEAYLEAPTGAYAVAAAEVIAALIGNPRDDLPAEVSSWIETQDTKPDSELVEAARKALVNVLDENISELAQLFGDSESDYREWRNDIEALLKRLQ